LRLFFFNKVLKYINNVVIYVRFAAKVPARAARDRSVRQEVDSLLVARKFNDFNGTTVIRRHTIDGGNVRVETHDITATARPVALSCPWIGRKQRWLSAPGIAGKLL
jgi:hypothetical protein